MSSDKDQSIFAGALFAGALLTYLFVSHEKLERSKRVKRRWEKIHKYIGEISRSHEKPISKSHASATSSADDKEKKQEVSHGRVLENACISEIRLHDIDMLQSHHNSANKPNEAWHNPKDAEAFQCGQHKYNKLVTDDEYILHNIIRGKHNSSGASAKSEAFMRAGPRAFTHFDPLNVNAAIVCSGGLCPGLNNVIREIVDTLHYQYGVNSVRGIMGGFHGFKNDKDYVLLTPEKVADIHHYGGTVISSSRGGFDADIILDYLKKHDICQLYIIGGDGTHRAANALCTRCLSDNLNIGIAGIPKTIDNDVDLIDRSFGFQTSVEAAQDAIRSAKTEARCNYPNGIGIVELMGRSSGLIAAHATISNGDVDLCLIPEVDTPFQGKDGALEFIRRRVQKQGHAVIVVGEGFGEVIFGKSKATDAGGNRKLPAIGPYLKELVSNHFKEMGSTASVKYIDPSYMIRSVPANASDALYCMMLGQNAVHGCMAGFTNFSTGLINNRVCYIPIPRIVATSPRGVDPHGRTWERVLSITRQPQAC